MAIVDTVALIAPLAISILGVILNLLSMLGLLGFKALRQIKNISTFHLSLCDFVASSCIVMTYVSYLHPGLMSSLWAQHIFSTALLMSLLSTLAIAVERFIIFQVDPFGNRKIITPRRAILVFSVTWAFVTGIFYLGAHFRDRPSFYMLGKVILFSSIWITMIGTAACYGFVYRRITSSSRDIGQSENFLQRRVKVHEKIIMTFSLVIGSTALCWVPLTVAELLKGFSQFGDRGWFIALDRVSFSILCFNQVLNPIIIWSRLTHFRNQLRGCRRGCRANSREDQEQTNVTSVFSVPVNVVPVNDMTVDRIATTSP